MTEGVTIEIKGGKELAQFLETLPAKTANKIVRQGLREGAKIIERNIERAAPVGPTRTRKGKVIEGGRLKRSIKVRAGRRSRGSISMLVTTSGSDNLFQGDQYYGGFVEFGHFIGKRRTFARKREHQERFWAAAAKGVDILGRKADKLGRLARTAGSFVPGEHFMQYGAEEVMPQASTAIVERIRGGIELERAK